MPGFHLYRSASTQALAERFVQVVTDPAAQLPPEQDELVVVQGRGMERWLSQRAADVLGVWAGAQFPFPRAAAGMLAARVLGETPAARSADDEQVLELAVAAELPGLMAAREGVRVAQYVGQSTERLLTFAQQAAGVMDQYLVCRADLLEQWAACRPTALPTADEQWQAGLWQRLLRRAESHPALAELVGFWPRVRRATEVLTALDAGAQATGQGSAPESAHASAQGAALRAALGVQRVSVFAVAGVPPQLVEFFVALARVCHVHWYAVDPGTECAGTPTLLAAGLGAADLQSVALVQEQVAKGQASGLPVERVDVPAVLAASRGSRLARVQALALGRADDAAAESGGGVDRTLRVHACTGRMRQAEVLHDELLDAFQHLPGLKHEDIVVLVPDIAAFGPVVEAVMRGGRGIPAPPSANGAVARMPCTVADVADRDGAPVAAALQAALRMADSDMGVRSVLELLSQPPVRERFVPEGLAADDLVGWAEGAGARRFMDAEHRQAAGLPPTEEATWGRALDRLYAGLAAAPTDTAPVPGAGLLPSQPFLLDEHALGQLSELVELLQALRHLAAMPAQPLPAWLREFRAVLQRLAPAFGPGEREARALQQQLSGMDEACAAAGLDADVSFAAARVWVSAQLGRAQPGRGFLSGGVTVCQFVPMRAVPFRVVCMLGMDDDAFPRPMVRPSFDLLSREQRLGDRDRRAEDQALFLQSVLNAAERVVITYGARDPNDGRARATSTAVAELLDALRAAAPEDEGAVVHQPLHAFSLGAWTEEAMQQGRVGFDNAARTAAGRLAAGVHDGSTGAFLQVAGHQAAELGAPEAGGELPLTELVQFLRRPARTTLRAWDIRLPEEAVALPEHELVGLDALQAGGLRSQVLRAMQERGLAAQQDVLLRMAQDAELPLGATGEQIGGAVAQQLAALWNAAYPGGVEWQDVRVDAGSVVLTGRVPVVSGAVSAVVSGNLNAARRLEAWVLQAAWAAHQGGAPEGMLRSPAGLTDSKGRMVLGAKDGAWGRAWLAKLVALRSAALLHGVPLFGEVSAAAASRLARGVPLQHVLASAREAVHRGDLEREDQILFRGVDPLTVDLGAVPGVGRAVFADVARAVFEPIATAGRPAKGSAS
ncbi:MAG: exodeoxyribonuclease V subunit gamma [Phycisphaerales bacterium]